MNDFLSGLGDLFQKAGSTAIDVIAANKTNGVTSTNADVNPASYQAKVQASTQQAAITPNYVPWIIGGVAALAGIGLLIALTRKS